MAVVSIPVLRSVIWPSLDPGFCNSTDLLDVVVGKGAAILELLAGEDQALLVRGNSLLVLDLGLDIVDGVRRLHLKGDSLARDCARGQYVFLSLSSWRWTYGS